MSKRKSMQEDTFLSPSAQPRLRRSSLLPSRNDGAQHAADNSFSSRTGSTSPRAGGAALSSRAGGAAPDRARHGGANGGESDLVGNTHGQRKRRREEGQTLTRRQIRLERAINEAARARKEERGQERRRHREGASLPFAPTTADFPVAPSSARTDESPGGFSSGERHSPSYKRAVDQQFSAREQLRSRSRSSNIRRDALISQSDMPSEGRRELPLQEGPLRAQRGLSFQVSSVQPDGLSDNGIGSDNASTASVEQGVRANATSSGGQVNIGREMPASGQASHGSTAVTPYRTADFPGPSDGFSTAQKDSLAPRDARLSVRRGGTSAQNEQVGPPGSADEINATKPVSSSEHCPECDTHPERGQQSQEAVVSRRRSRRRALLNYEASDYAATSGQRDVNFGTSSGIQKRSVSRGRTQPEETKRSEGRSELASLNALSSPVIARSTPTRHSDSRFLDDANIHGAESYAGSPFTRRKSLARTEDSAAQPQDSAAQQASASPSGKAQAGGRSSVEEGRAQEEGRKKNALTGGISEDYRCAVRGDAHSVAPEVSSISKLPLSSTGLTASPASSNEVAASSANQVAAIKLVGTDSSAVSPVGLEAAVSGVACDAVAEVAAESGARDAAVLSSKNAVFSPKTRAHSSENARITPVKKTSRMEKHAFAKKEESVSTSVLSRSEISEALEEGARLSRAERRKHERALTSAGSNNLEVSPPAFGSGKWVLHGLAAGIATLAVVSIPFLMGQGSAASASQNFTGSFVAGQAATAADTPASLSADPNAAVKSTAESASREGAAQTCTTQNSAAGVRAAFSPEADLTNIVVMPLGEGTYRYTSAFGYRVDPIYGGTSMHAGQDMAAPLNTPIYAVADGVVTHAGKGIEGRSNNVIVVKHEIKGKTYYSWYVHMYDSGVLVKEGDKVTAGQRIGLVGSNGNSTGPHLHLEIHDADNRLLNPVDWLNENKAVFVSRLCN